MRMSCLAGRLIGLLLLLACFCSPVSAAIDALALGARYDATQANIAIRVYSSRATRIELWIYKTASGAQERVRYVMSKDSASSSRAGLIMGSLFSRPSRPRHAARGSFVGLFCAFTPSVGIQTPMVLIAWANARRFPRWDFNLLLAIAWTWVTNAFTALPCYYAFYLTGQIMFGQWNRLAGFNTFRLMWDGIFSADQSMLEQMQALARLLILDWGVTILVGSLPWALLTGWLGYRYSLKFLLAYRHARAERMKKRHDLNS